MWEVVNDESEDSPEEGGMSFLDHLEELRWTLVKCAAAFLVACVLIGVFVFQFADLLRWPYDFAMAKFDGVEDRLFVRGFMGAFSVMFQLFFLGGLCLSLPAMLYFLGKFVSPGMTASERKVLGPASAAAVVLFLSGASFSFFILLPAGLSASIYFSIQFGFDLLIDAASYYSLLLWATMGVGAAFEFPLLLLLLIHLGILGTEKLVTYRRHAIVGFLVLSAVVTPTPDPITFLFLAVPLQVLYEISIIVGRWVEKKREERMKILDVD
jgi:sec-independent protein translocase protein TatC